MRPWILRNSFGGGPGGYAAAFLGADLGLSVTLIDSEPRPGGVCVYRGCIPSKALLHVANLLDEAKHASAWGISFGDPKIDLNKLREFKNNVVKKLTEGTSSLAKFRKVNYIQGWATLNDPQLFSRDPARFEAASKGLEKAGTELTAAEDQWLELEMLREEIENG